MGEYGLLLIGLVLVAYWVLMYWLSNVAKKDLERRGQPGWVFGSFIFWSNPMGLLSWWQARRRYPILDEGVKPKSS